MPSLMGVLGESTTSSRVNPAVNKYKGNLTVVWVMICCWLVNRWVILCVIKISTAKIAIEKSWPNQCVV